ncbi:sigma-70 family RNA polymerase sigma factor [Persicitalea jodogahamensis]|uniref:DNA-directed RNA polymerase sigma-70 factor n=1 Tax=Persicitalea jodogahamensis TaxID=402147 RepID=A0A8J3G9R5_9BACT|nr:sigma-70 family RNA polymerase sigma factor [Persicitalea jodogahamensis]GHB65411.1 DNA-directed RNA polymerase sigma-70 factor [Persicitalea jodogahamensis]
MRESNLTDEELVHLLKKSNPNAYEAIYKRYWRYLYGFVFQQLGTKEDAEEIVHDLMLSIWQNRQTVCIQNLKVYLFIAARNLTNKSIKARINLRKYQEHVLLHEVFDNFQTNEIPSPHSLSQAVEKVLTQMPEKTARIFRMSKMDELPVKTIASKMDLSEKAVEYHITKSLKLLRHQLQNFHSDN